jgi:hypothetical protein
MTREMSTPAHGIKRCSACGKSIGRVLVDWNHKQDGKHRVYVECPLCHARSNSYASSNAAIDEWNDGKISRTQTYQESMIDLLEANNG